MPVCIHCKKEKPITEFAKRKQSYRGSCRKCHNEQKIAWVRANPIKRATSSHNHYAKQIGKGPDECRATRVSASKRLENKMAANKRHYENNKKLYVSRAKQRVQESPSEIRAYNKEWRQKNATRKKENDVAWRKANPILINVYSNARRARKLRAQPEWLTAIDLAEVQSFYEIAAARNTQTGVKHHVDHIVPLQGKNVCGLHVPWNLQVLHAKDNLSKGARLQESV